MTQIKLSIKEQITTFEEYGIETTDNIDESIYILSDGTLLSGMFDYGLRSEDHRCIECIMEEDRYSDIILG